MKTVLVACATRNGSTQQVAEHIAATLRDQGVQAQCRSARTVRDAVHDVDLVVLGAPLYNGRWHRDTHRFLKRNRHQLPPVTVFGMGPRTDEAQAWLRSRAQFDRALTKHRWLAPTSVALLGGVDRPGKAAGRPARLGRHHHLAAHLTHHVPRPTA